MRRIEYILPVACIRGAIARKQRYLYPTNNNEGWFAPNGLQTATNYRAKLIGAKKEDTGAPYFMVRTKTTINWNANTRTNTAVFAGACALYRGITATANLYSQLQNVANAARNRNSLRVFTFPYLQTMLRDKAQNCTITAGQVSVTFENPWQNAGVSNVPVSTTVYNKYNNVLT